MLNIRFLILMEKFLQYLFSLIGTFGEGMCSNRLVGLNLFILIAGSSSRLFDTFLRSLSL